jgi:ABC-type lipoprotein export system ATPase subunit
MRKRNKMRQLKKCNQLFQNINMKNKLRLKSNLKLPLNITMHQQYQTTMKHKNMNISQFIKLVQRILKLIRSHIMKLKIKLMIMLVSSSQRIWKRINKFNWRRLQLMITRRFKRFLVAII